MCACVYLYLYVTYVHTTVYVCMYYVRLYVVQI